MDYYIFQYIIIIRYIRTRITLIFYRYLAFASNYKILIKIALHLFYASRISNIECTNIAYSTFGAILTVLLLYFSNMQKFDLFYVFHKSRNFNENSK